ncbi:la-related protein 4 isoform X1 [Gadus macrocephalus]|uniref:la-related protein 4 isoform X1 n=1 Tax=Gadus macrocephalus TaxID=80720 RepID=UPI0028CB8098|nr:la-related protein 4 isoform X1 [Gadus macrocephalus]
MTWSRPTQTEMESFHPNEEETENVTTKGGGLNPNAKVWQEIPAPQNGLPAGGQEEPGWLQPTSPSGEGPEGFSEVAFSDDKGYSTEYSDTSDGVPALAVEGLTNGGAEPLDFGYPLFDAPGGGPADAELVKEEPMSEENLRESLKKQLEFCFSRENLCKDLYLMSQMDSDQFVPVWTLACMEDIKVLTTDSELILEVLKASPMLEVDEAGEKVRPNHKRCIIILREVPETTPVEEVEALFKSDSCPKVISVEFAHNSNWYITFQSDTDAQQAYKYLREEVKMFQGKPIMARIKAISTFFANNGFRSVDSSAFSRSPAASQPAFNSPLYMQPVYSPQQQQYPVYPLVTPSWNQSATPYFETPLAPFPNSGFANSYNGSAPYKGSGSAPAGRTFNRSRLQGKSHPRPGALPALIPGLSRDGGSAPTSPLLPQTPGAAGAPPQEAVVMPSLHMRDLPPGDMGLAGRGRRGGSRGMRRRREDDRTLRPVPLIEVKPPAPKFDLASSSFPPLPGCVVTSTQEEAVPETRLSDVVRGRWGPDKAENKEERREARPPKAPEAAVAPPAVVPAAVAPVPAPATPLIVATPVLSVSQPTKTPPKTKSPPETAEPAPPQELVPVPVPVLVQAQAQAPTESGSPPAAEPVPDKETTCRLPGSPATAPTPTQSLVLESRKLSYAAVCQLPAKELPARPPSPSSSPDPEATQPLRELGVNKAEDPRTPSNQSAGRGAEKPGEAGAPREPLGSYRGVNGPPRASGLKGRERPRAPPPGRRAAPQGGAPRHSGKEQNIPPRSAK